MQVEGRGADQGAVAGALLLAQRLPGRVVGRRGGAVERDVDPEDPGGGGAARHDRAGDASVDPPRRAADGGDGGADRGGPASRHGEEESGAASLDARVHDRRRVGDARVERGGVAGTQGELDRRLDLAVGLDGEPDRLSAARGEEAEGVPSALEVGPLHRDLAEQRVEEPTRLGDSARGPDRDRRAEAERVGPDQSVAVAALAGGPGERGARRVGVAREEGSAQLVADGGEIGGVGAGVHRQEVALMGERDREGVGRAVDDGADASAADDQALLPGRGVGRRDEGGHARVRVVARAVDRMIVPSVGGP